MRTRFVVLLIAGLLMAPGLAAAQNATPAASPVASPVVQDPCFTTWQWCKQTGYKGRVYGSFQPTGTSSYGLAEMTIGAAQFDTPANAQIALPNVLHTFVTGFVTDVSQVFPSSVRQMGDRALAYAGPATDKRSDKSVWTGNVAAIVVQTGNIIWYSFADGSSNTNALTELAPIVEKLIQGKPVTNADINSLTPGVDDVPEGWRLVGSGFFGH